MSDEILLAKSQFVVRRNKKRSSSGYLIQIYAALLIFFVVIVCALLPQFISPYDPYDIDPSISFQPPSVHHWFGTDQSGRDTLSRVIYGTRFSLFIGFLSIITALVLGALLAFLSQFRSKVVSHIVERTIDILFSFPGIILALICIAIFGSSAVTLGLAVGIGSAGGYARIIRTQTRLVTEAGYVSAVRMLGYSPAHILFFTILPNIIRPLLPLFTLGVGQCIVWATGLSFLGIGVQPPQAEWGALLADSRNYTSVAWWLTVFPGAMIALTSLSLTLLGRHLQSIFDSRGHE